MDIKTRLTQIGEKLVLDIDKTLLKQLNITSKTVFEIKTDGKSIILTPVSNLKISDNPKIQDAADEILEKYDELFKKLSKT